MRHREGRNCRNMRSQAAIVGVWVTFLISTMLRVWPFRECFAVPMVRMG